jgi:hypothetical protein
VMATSVGFSLEWSQPQAKACSPQTRYVADSSSLYLRLASGFCMVFGGFCSQIGTCNLNPNPKTDFRMGLREFCSRVLLDSKPEPAEVHLSRSF